MARKKPKQEEPDETVATEHSDEQPITHQGFLFKQGAGKKKFNKRWFVVRGMDLKYFGSKDTTKKEKGSISLKNLTAAAREDEKPPRSHMFTLSHPTDQTRIYIMSALDEAAMQKWIVMINAASTLASKPKAPIKSAKAKLGIDSTTSFRHVSDSDIKKAYRKGALAAHPDKGGDLQEFNELQDSYEIALSCKERHDLEAEQFDKIAISMPLQQDRPLGIGIHDYLDPPVNRPRIKRIYADSSAAASGKLEIGDLLVEVEERDTRGLPFEEVMAYMRAARPPRIEFKVLRRKEQFGGPLILAEDGKESASDEEDAANGGDVEDWRVAEEEEERRNTNGEDDQAHGEVGGEEQEEQEEQEEDSQWAERSKKWRQGDKEESSPSPGNLQLSATAHYEEHEYNSAGQSDVYDSDAEEEAAAEDEKQEVDLPKGALFKGLRRRRQSTVKMRTQLLCAMHTGEYWQAPMWAERRRVREERRAHIREAAQQRVGQKLPLQHRRLSLSPQQPERELSLEQSNQDMLPTATTTPENNGKQSKGRRGSSWSESPKVGGKGKGKKGGSMVREKVSFVDDKTGGDPVSEDEDTDVDDAGSDVDNAVSDEDKDEVAIDALPDAPVPVPVDTAERKEIAEAAPPDTASAAPDGPADEDAYTDTPAPPVPPAVADGTKAVATAKEQAEQQQKEQAEQQQKQRELEQRERLLEQRELEQRKFEQQRQQRQEQEEQEEEEKQRLQEQQQEKEKADKEEEETSQFAASLVAPPTPPPISAESHPPPPPPSIHLAPARESVSAIPSAAGVTVPAPVMVPPPPAVPPPQAPPAPQPAALAPPPPPPAIAVVSTSFEQLGLQPRQCFSEFDPSWIYQADDHSDTVHGRSPADQEVRDRQSLAGWLLRFGLEHLRANLHVLGAHRPVDLLDLEASDIEELHLRKLERKRSVQYISSLHPSAPTIFVLRPFRFDQSMRFLAAISARQKQQAQ
jgi:hypothetical protein